MIEIIGIIATVITPILILVFKVNFVYFINRKAQNFKKIRKEYLEDKIVGYFYFQSFLGISLPKNQIDFILNSEDAYSILKVIKNSSGKYIFNGKKFKSNINRSGYILPIIGYLISSITVSFYLFFINEIRKYLNLYSYLLILLILISVFMPIFINSLFRISEIRDVRKLEKITSKSNKNK